MMKKELIDILSQLVGINTTKDAFNYQVEEVINDIFYYAQSHISITKENHIISHIIGYNCDLHDVIGGIVFAGHIDTVDTKAPLQIVEKDGCIYGKGVSDMKSFFACINEVLQYQDKDYYSFPIIIAITFDEETNNSGVKSVITYFKENNIHPRYCILGEPTNLHYSLHSKCCYDYIIKICGNSYHSTSLSTGTKSPVLIGCDLLTWISSIDDENCAVIPCWINTHRSFNVSGTECEIGIELRSYDDDIVNQWISNIKKHIKTSNYILKEQEGGLIAFNNTNSFLRTLFSSTETEGECLFLATSEGGYYATYGMDTILFGPGNLDCAHKDSENIELVKIKTYIFMIKQLLAGIE